MVKLVGNDIYRGGEKIGWLQTPHIFAHDGKKLGYFEGIFVYNADARKIAYLEGNFLVPEGGGPKVPVQKIVEDVTGGVIPDIERAAIFVLLGN
jgi:hypothetical protein